MSVVPFAELPPDVQERLRAAGHHVPSVDEPSTPPSPRASAQRKRRKTGDDFEAELDVYHAYLEFSKFGKIRRNWVPTKVVGAPRRGVQQRVVVGPAHVDRTGWVRVHRPHGVGGFLPGAGPNAQVIPVAFDAKVIGEKTRRGWYSHDPKLQHQLHDLKAAAEAGEYAFLLVLDRSVERAFAIPIQEHLTALLSGEGVQLYERGASDAAFAPLLPSISKCGGEIRWWAWMGLLELCAPR